MSLRKTFGNELGNEITIETRVYYDDDDACEMVGISIKGPRSESSWIITAEEALEVQRQIGLLLHQPTSAQITTSPPHKSSPARPYSTIKKIFSIRTPAHHPLHLSISHKFSIVSPWVC